MTERGQPITAPGFGNWFRDRCNEAGLKGLSAHGMRKAASTRAAERGATAHQLMAIFGWRTIKQAEVYTRAAERKWLAGDAMHLLGTEGGQKSLTLNPQTSAVREKGKKLRYFKAWIAGGAQERTCTNRVASPVFPRFFVSCYADCVPALCTFAKRRLTDIQFGKGK